MKRDGDKELRPLSIAALCVFEAVRFIIIFVYYLVGVYSGESSLSFGLIFNLIIWIVSVGGIMAMKKWGVIIYITVQIYFLYNSIMLNDFNFIAYVILAILIYFIVKNYKKMK
jgi:hypothetical protein